MKWLLGWLTLRICGTGALRFINLCKMNEILLWNVKQFEKEEFIDTYNIEIKLRDYIKIRPLVRKTRVKVAIVQKCGLPFLLYKARKNKGFLTGVVICSCILFYSQSLIWDIRVEGNLSVTTQQIERFLFERGMRRGMSKKDVQYNKTEREILENFDDISWCSIKSDKGILWITVNENAVFQKETGDVDYTGKNLVANIDGKVEEIVVREGALNVRKGQIVSKGDVLVVGRIPIMNEIGELDHYKEVTPSAKIIISYDYPYEDILDRKWIQKEYTGRCSYGFLWKGKSFLLKEFADYDVEYLYNFPIFKEHLTIIRVSEYQKKEYLLSDAMAENILHEKLRFFIDSFIEKGVQIIGNDVKIIGSIDSFRMEGVIRMQGEFDE